MMDPTNAFNIQIGMGVVLCAVIAKKYVWPKLKVLPQSLALVPLLIISSFRFLGLTFTVPNLNFGLPLEFMNSVGYGDFFASLLALLALVIVLYMPKLGKGFAWIYAIVGTLDLIYGIFLASSLNIYSHLGVSWLVMIVVGPIQIVTLFMLWRVLLRREY
jgi:hypothetical protein